MKSAILVILFVWGSLIGPCGAQSELHQPYQWRSVPIGGGGYVLDVYCHPKQKNLVYIRTDVGGFYRWDASHERWIPLTDGFSQAQSNYYGGEGLALDPTDPHIVYIAAGKYTWSATPGTIFKSVNQGRTWKKLPIDLPMGGNEDHRWGGQRLMVSPLHPHVLLFGSRTDGLWRSANAGASWAKVGDFPATLQKGLGITAVAFDPSKPGVAYAAAYGDGVYRSGDDGLTWQRTAGGPAHVERLTAASNGVLYATHAHGIAQYANGHWQDVTPAGVTGAFGGLAVDPRDPQDILAAMQTDHLRLFRSRDGGTTWGEEKYQVRSSVPWYSSSMRKIQYVAGITFDPCVPNRVWLTDWYATYVTSDINASPIVLQNHERGHEELVVFTLAAPPGGLSLLSGVADVDGFAHQSLNTFPAHGFGSYYGGTGPTFGDTDQITWCAAQPRFVARVGVMRWNNSGGGALSSDGGRTWSAFPSWDSKIMPGRIAIGATDPHNMMVLRVHSGAGLFTRDGGKTWQNSSGLPDNIVPDVWYWQVPLTSDGATQGVFYVASGGKVYKSVDSGATFHVAASGLPTSDQALLSVPGRAGELWLATGDGGLYHSTDGGATFAKIITVSKAPLFTLGKSAPDAHAPTLYLDGTLATGRTGIFRSLDNGTTWQEIDDPHMPIGDVPSCMSASFQTFGQVFIGTNGRGIYVGQPHH